MSCCRANAIPVVKRPEILALAIGRTMDKSSNVRRKAIQLLVDFIHNHPFCIDGGELSRVLFETRLGQIEQALQTDEANDILVMQRQYYQDALAFVDQLDSVIPQLIFLLSSTTRSEVFDVMEFLVEAHIYQLSTAEVSATG